MARQCSVKKNIEDICKSIYKKTGNKTRFFPTSKIQLLPPPPIGNISIDFPPTTAKLQDFFQVHEVDSRRHVEIHLSFTMPGTTKSVLHVFMVNTLKQNNLWLTSNKLAGKRNNGAVFVKNGNPTYTYHQGIAGKLMAAITKLASTNSEAAALFDKIKGEKFISCTSKQLYGKQAIEEGISILTTNNNYGIIMRLIGMLPPNSISHYYQVISKMIKKAMNPYLYDELILRHQDEVNKQRHIVLMNIGVDLFETQVNFTKHIPTSMSTSIRKFLYGPEKVLAIEQTVDTEDL